MYGEHGLVLSQNECLCLVLFSRQCFYMLFFEEGYEVFSFLCEPVVFGGQELVFFDVVNF